MAIAWNRKVSDNEVLDAYRKFKSVWKAAKHLNLCGQTVHERLQKLNAIEKPNYFTLEELEKIKLFYLQGVKRGDGKLDAFCKEMKRGKATVVKKAKEMGLTNKKRLLSEEFKKEIGERSIIWHDKNPHPRGMLGKTHSKELCEAQSMRMKVKFAKMTREQKRALSKKSIITKLERYGQLNTWEDTKKSWRQGWREIGGKRSYYRSRWEANYGHYLQWLTTLGEVIKWEHEPKTFWFDNLKRGCVSYRPDFYVEERNGKCYWVEVKGYMDPKSLTKIKRFRKYFPNEELRVIDAKWFKKNGRSFVKLVPNWESARSKKFALEKRQELS